MTKFLSIIIPHYNETIHEIFPLLTSIHNQAGIDHGELEVILVHDCGPEESLAGLDALKEILNYSLDIIRMDENKGPGVARQTGIDAAKGQYVMFCDADDILHSAGVLGAFTGELKLSQPDILASPWLEELRGADGSFAYVTHDDEATWMHGKALKSSYIRDNNIRFHDTLRVHEDSYFLSLAYDMTDNIRKLTFPTYIWKWRQNSIVRRNNSSYTYDSAPVFNRAVCLAIGEMERRGLRQKLPFKVIQLICYTFCTVQQGHWRREAIKAQRAAAEESLVKEITPYLTYFHQAPPEMLIEIYNTERAKHIRDTIEDELFSDWLKRLGLIT